MITKLNTILDILKNKTPNDTAKTLNCKEYVFNKGTITISILDEKVGKVVGVFLLGVPVISYYPASGEVEKKAPDAQCNGYLDKILGELG